MKEPTPRELEILREYVRTGSVKEAAYRCGIKNQSARNRLRRLYGTLGVGSALEATMALGWLKIP